MCSPLFTGFATSFTCIIYILIYTHVYKYINVLCLLAELSYNQQYVKHFCLVPTLKKAGAPRFSSRNCRLWAKFWQRNEVWSAVDVNDVNDAWCFWSRSVDENTHECVEVQICFMMYCIGFECSWVNQRWHQHFCGGGKFHLSLSNCWRLQGCKDQSYLLYVYFHFFEFLNSHIFPTPFSGGNLNKSKIFGSLHVSRTPFGWPNRTWDSSTLWLGMFSVYCRMACYYLLL